MFNKSLCLQQHEIWFVHLCLPGLLVPKQDHLFHEVPHFGENEKEKMVINK